MPRYASAGGRSPLVLVLMAALILLGPLLGPSGRAAAQAASGNLQLINLDKVPYDDRLAMQRINAKPGRAQHKQATLRIKNSGDGPLAVASLAISGADSASFTITAADAAGFTLAPGASRDVVVKFVAGTSGKVKGLRAATLTIRSDDPDSPTQAVELSGYNMLTDQGTNEPSLQEILDTFGYRSIILNPGEDQRLDGARVNGIFTKGAYAAVGDEVLSAYWTRANKSRSVYVRQLATFVGTGTHSIVISGSGGNSVTHGSNQTQTMLPLQEDLTTPVEMTLNPTSSKFEVRVAGFSSARGAQGLTHAVRFWPVRDRSGALVPNSYIVAEDAVGSAQTNYDYQDNVYLITNIRPFDQAADPSIPAAAPGDSSLILDFDKAYAGTLGDKDSQGTGFSQTQRNKGDISFPQNPPSSSYDKTRLDLVTSGQGTLSIQSRSGTNQGSVNTLVNGLCLPFDARSGRVLLSTRLIGPLSGLSSPTQLAGLMFGPSQGDFIRLSAGTQASSGIGGQPWIQLAEEIDNTITQIGPLVSIPSADTISTLDLQLIGDPDTGAVTAAYRVNGGAPIALAQGITLSDVRRARFFGPQAEGCLLAQSTGASEFSATFDRFAIEPAPPVAGLPTVSAGADQEVANGASVTLSGTATDVGGNPLTGTWQQVGGSPQVALSGSGNSRTFTAPASYSLLSFAFSASDGQGRSASDSLTVKVGTAPITDLLISSNSPVGTDAVTRLATSISGGDQPIGYRWNFGDGTPAVTGGPVIDHRYTTAGSYTVSLVATNPAGSVSASATVVAQAPVPDFALRYDTGSLKDVTTGGVLWKSDKGLFTPANSPAEKRGVGIPPIANTTDDVIYQTYRGKDTSLNQTVTYEVPINSQIGVPDGTQVRVNLRLHFAELYWGGTTAGAGPGGNGKRVFDVLVEGEKVLDNFDITTAAGKAETAVIVPVEGVRVTDGKLTLALKAVTDYPAISAFEILRAPDVLLENVAPNVFAGADQAVATGTSVALAGSASDTDSGPLTYAWAQAATGAPSVTLAGSGLNRSFTPPAAGSYTFTLTATDAGGLSASDSVTIVASGDVTPGNRAPVVSAGPDQSVATGSLVLLAGSASDPDGDALAIGWQQANTGAPSVTLAGNGLNRSFTPPAAGSYTFTLTASDGSLSASDSVTIVASGSLNHPPSANAGPDKSVIAGSQVALSGSASDPDGDQLTYAWAQVASGAPSVTLAGSGANRSFTPSTAGAYIFSFTATDGGGLSSTDTVVINVTATSPGTNHAPVARAGADISLTLGGAVSLSGSASDVDGGALTYSWVQSGGPAVTLAGSGANRSFTPTLAGDYTFTLIVTDNGGLSSTDDLRVTVRSRPSNAPNLVYLPQIVR